MRCFQTSASENQKIRFFLWINCNSNGFLKSQKNVLTSDSSNKEQINFMFSIAFFFVGSVRVILHTWYIVRHTES